MATNIQGQVIQIQPNKRLTLMTFKGNPRLKLQCGPRRRETGGETAKAKQGQSDVNMA